MAEKPSDLDNLSLYILVLHWESPQYTRACLASLRKLTYPTFKVLLVDNGSKDNSGIKLAAEFPEVVLLSLTENLGFAGGCNAGIDFCLKQGADWIWLLNNDTEVAADSLELLVSHARQCQQAGVLGAMVYTSSGENVNSFGPGRIDFLRAKTHIKPTVHPGVSIVDCEWLAGNNLLLRATAIKAMQGFDEDFFLYFEDTDLCYRLRLAGWQCLLVPEAKVCHVGGGSTEGRRAVWRAYYYTRNRLLFFLRYLKGLRAVPAVVFIAAHLLRHAIVLPFRGSNGRQQLKAELLGLRDYFCHRFGKATCLDWCE